MARPGQATAKFKQLLAASAGQGVEGLVLKKQSSAYAPGRRTGDWLLVRSENESHRPKRPALTAAAEPVARTNPASPSAGAS